MAEQAMMTASAMAAAFVGGDAAKEFLKMIESLEREGGLQNQGRESEPDEATKIAAALGLRFAGGE